MRTNSYFNFNRLYHLIRNELITQYRTLLIATGAIFGVLLFLNIITINASRTWDFHKTFYLIVLFFGGYTYTASVFKELHQYPKNYAFLTLPASIFEKFLTKFLTSSIGFIIVSVITYFLFSIIASIVTRLIFGSNFPIFNPFQNNIITSIKVYLITQSVFLFGSVYFKSHNLLKTLLALFLISIVLSFYSVLLTRILFIWTYENNIIFPPIEFDIHTFESLGNQLAQIFSFIFHFLLAPFFWVLTYLRLKETEV